ncbi:hypothetical protein FRX31_002525 [Thalictrum thalictroides]|uniref:GATA-type domain-containing protein n=1 Tax=Thalictrum thalictroides TaxID=46969 RepID=A0A7J6XH36_THATH|nr:hypothetical protein FRX31_002525 [Thalictrum thalictroides]
MDMEKVTRDMNICADCEKTETSCWRCGPAGPKSLCNACYMRPRNRKKKEVLKRNIAYVCGDCKTTETSLRRYGPKSLCSACYLRRRNQKRKDHVRKKNNNQCADCKTTETSLWRCGPAGQSLCNACYLRPRNRMRRELMRKKIEDEYEAAAALLLLSYSNNQIINAQPGLTSPGKFHLDRNEVLLQPGSAYGLMVFRHMMSEMDLKVVSLATGGDVRDNQQCGQTDQKQKMAIVVASDTDQDDEQAKTVSESVKACSNCRITKTSLWRKGPAGPKSLCNACYLRASKEKNRIAKAAYRAREKDKKTAAILMHMSYLGTWMPFYKYKW